MLPEGTAGGVGGLPSSLAAFSGGELLGTQISARARLECRVPRVSRPVERVISSRPYARSNVAAALSTLMPRAQTAEP